MTRRRTPTIEAIQKHLKIGVVDKRLSNAESTRVRNFFAARSAYLRGETEVILFDSADVPPFRFGSLGLGDQPSVVDDLIHVGGRDVDPDRLTDSVMRDETLRSIRKTVRDLASNSYESIPRLDFIKILGKGGYGAVGLFRQKSDDRFDEGHGRLLAIKIPVNEHRSNLGGEKEYYQRYKYASHITQTVDAFALSGADMYQQSRHRNQPGRATNPVMMMDYAAHGSLCKAVQMIQILNLDIPTSAAWLLWESLVLGVAEVAYQLEFRTRWNQDFVQRYHEAEQGPNLEQFFRLLEHVPISHDVHFDTEFQNILVYGDAERPAFKLHDLAPPLSAQMRRVWSAGDEAQYWTLRNESKDFQAAPEQFSAEWDTLEAHPQGHIRFATDILPNSTDPFLQRPQGAVQATTTAGRYGSWTNLYFISKVMESFLCRRDLSFPFITQPLNEEDPDDGRRTYGWRLRRRHHRPNEESDRPLLDVLLACQCEKPEDRPSLIELLRHLSSAKRRGRLDSTDESRYFWSQVLGPAPIFLKVPKRPSPPVADQHQNNNSGGGRRDNRRRRPRTSAERRAGEATDRKWRRRMRNYALLTALAERNDAGRQWKAQEEAEEMASWQTMA